MRSNKYYAVPEEGESLEHNVKGSQRKYHKYIARKLVNGKWQYTYKEDQKMGYAPGTISTRQYKENRKEWQKVLSDYDSSGAGDKWTVGNALKKAEARQKAQNNLNAAYGNRLNVEKRKATGSSSLGDDRVPSNNKQSTKKKSSSKKHKLPLNVAKTIYKGKSAVDSILHKIKHSGMEDGEYLEHNVKGSQRKNHKYIARKLVNGKWQYTYKYGDGSSRLTKEHEKSKQRYINDMYNAIDGLTGKSFEDISKDSAKGAYPNTIKYPFEQYEAADALKKSYANRLNVEKRKATGSSSLGNDRVLSGQTENKLKAKSNAKKTLDKQSGTLNWEKSARDGYKKASNALKETNDLRDSYNRITGKTGTESAASKYAKKSAKASEGVAKAGMAINAAKRKASGSSSLANQKQSTKKKKTSKVSKALKKGQSIINKLLGR